MKQRVVLAVLLLLPMGMAGAQEVDPNVLMGLQKQLAQQQEMLTELAAKLAAIESQKAQATPADVNLAKLQAKVDALQDSQLQQTRQQQALSQKVDYVQNGEINWPKGMEWVKNVKFKGDLRTRYEMIDEEGSDNRNRARIRARIGLDTKINDDVDAGFRLATSEVWGDDATSGDAVSTNQTLDDAFSKKTIWLDLAYFNWHPKDIAGLNVIGGKMENPFVRVGGNQLIWDGDLTPEGLAIQYTRPINDGSLEMFANAGAFYVDETKSGADTSLYGGQFGLKNTFEDKSYLLGGVGLYGYSQLEGHEAFVTVDGKDKFFGNSNSGGEYTESYTLNEFFGEYGFNVGQTPAAVYASYVQNNAADDENQGWLVGAKYGKCKDVGTWELSYDYRDLEKDAVVGIFSDSDFIGGGTNGKGHRIGATYQLAKNVQTGVSYFMDEKGDDEHDYDRLQADMIFKF